MQGAAIVQIRPGICGRRSQQVRPRVLHIRLPATIPSQDRADIKVPLLRVGRRNSGMGKKKQPESGPRLRSGRMGAPVAPSKPSERRNT